LNYAGPFDATPAPDGSAAPSYKSINIDHPPPHAPADAIVVPDAHFLFHANFKRSGVDLILSKDDRELVLHDYFKGEKRAALASPDGAHLTGSLVNALTGHVEVSQAGTGPAAGQVIGHVTKLQGTAAAVRNGVSIILNNGDDVQKGDIVESGSNSTLGITFIDGTVFGLASNARMVLNEMVYDPNGSNNSTLFNLVAGTITFVAGKTAKQGDMKIDTPVATMGIRGTAVLVQIDFTVPGQAGAPNASFQVLVEPDGTTGSYVLFDKTTLQPIAMVNQAGQQININNGVISQTNAPLPPDVQKLIQDVFTQKFTDNSNTKQTSPFTDTLNPLQQGLFIKTADGSTATSTYVIVKGPADPTIQNPNGPSDILPHIPGPPTVVVVDTSGNVTKAFSSAEILAKTGDGTLDTVSGIVRFADVNAGDQPTVKIAFSSFTYKNAGNTDVTATLSSLQLADVVATAVKIAVVPDGANKNIGSTKWTYSIADKAFDFLAAGEQLTLTYLVRVDNNYAPSNEATIVPITITITGTNDGPVIATSAQSIAFSGGTSVPGGTLPASDPTSGTLSFQDADLTDTHTVSTKLTSAVLSDGSTEVPPAPLALFEKALIASIATDSTGTGNGSVDWKLASLPVYVADFIPNGETLTLTYTVTVTDLQNATATQTVTVTITGTDNPAFVWIATTTDGETSGGFWGDGANWETGTVPTANDDAIIITDQLHGLTPSFPVKVNAPAFAKSITMNDFGYTPPELINLDHLTIGTGGLKLGADSILRNSGTIDITGAAEILDHSVVVNCGTLDLKGGGDFEDQSSITNAETGTIEISGGTLNVQVDIANWGQITVDPGATLALNAGSINGGAITIADGVLKLLGSSILKNGTLSNAGQIKVSGAGNAFDNETVTANSVLEILAGGALLLDLGTTIANAGGVVSVDSNALLALDDATIDGGTVAMNGTLQLEGASFLKNGALDNSGEIDVSGNGNVLRAETVTNTDTGTIDVAGVLTLDLGTRISGGTLNNSGTIHVETAAGATLEGVAVYNQDATIQIDDGQSPAPSTLKVGNGTAITGGTLAIGIAGMLEVSTNFGATLSSVDVDNDGVIQVDPGSVLALSDTTIAGGTLTNYGMVHVTGDSAISHDAFGNTQLTIDAAATLSIDCTTITGGAITVSGTLDTTGISAIDAADVTIADGGVLEVTGGRLSIECAGAAVGIINDGTLKAAGGKLTIVGETVTNDEGTVSAAVGSTLALVDAIISGGAVTIDGTLHASGHSAITDAIITDTGTVAVELSSTLELVDAVIKGGTINVAGTLDATGTSEIDGATIHNTGVVEVTEGTLIIDAASIIDNKGTFEADDGTLVVKSALSGDVDIVGKSTVELGASSVGAYAKVEIDFAPESTSLLKIDHAETFTGEIAGLDNDDALDLVDIKWCANATFSFCGDKNGGTLTIVSNGEVAQIKLEGDYLGSSWSLSNDGTNGIKVTEVPGVLCGLDSDGNAVEGQTIKVSITDGGQPVTDATYLFETSSDGQTWTVVQCGASNCYTPTGHDEGKQLKVEMFFTDGFGHHDTSSISAGTVQEPPNTAPVILSETNPTTQTIVLAESPIVLAPGVIVNALHLPNETFDTIDAGSASNNGQGYGNFYSSALHADFTASGNAGVTSGSSSVSAAPFIGPKPGQQDLSHYLSIGANSSETISFASEQNAFGLYWGSVDSFNKIAFYNGDKLVVSYTGADVSPLLASGGQGSFSSNGYVEFKDLAPFDKVVLTSGSSNAFEVDNLTAGYISDSHIKLAEPITGTLTVRDDDIGDTLTASVTGPAVVKYNGSTTLPSGINVDALINPNAVTFDSTTADGKPDVLHWTYHPTNYNLDFLEPGDKLTITFNAEVSDGHATAGNQPLTITLVGNGSSVIHGTAQNDVFDHVGGGVTIFGHGGNDTFVFNANFGSATIADFDVHHDTIDVDHTLFASVTEFVKSAQSINFGHDTVISDANHDKIVLAGVTVAELKAHQSDFHVI
jgi:fibronectin-binding autotransporter adhesin